MFVITVPSLSGSCWALVKLSASKLSLICEKNENNICFAYQFCRKCGFKGSFNKKDYYIYNIHTLPANIKLFQWATETSEHELFSCFKVLVQSNFIFADILYCAYTTMLCVQKIVQFRHKKEKHWTFLLNFLLGVYSNVHVQLISSVLPVSFLLCST